MFSHTKTPDFFQAIMQGMPFVAPNDQSGNPFQINLDYGGFTASPVQGTPQQIAAYQNVCASMSYGDVVNCEFIPEMAINRMTLMPVVNLRSFYQVTKKVEVFGLTQNLFDLRYYAAGIFFDNESFNSNTFGANNFPVLNDPRTFPPGMPFAACGWRESHLLKELQRCRHSSQRVKQKQQIAYRPRGFAPEETVGAND
jgi:hypothetical protein